MAQKRDGYRKGQLTAIPERNNMAGETSAGLQHIHLNQKKECLLYVPPGYRPNMPAALALMLHGAGGNAAHGLSYIQQYADEYNILLLAPASHDYSWDIIAANSFGIDVLFIDHALSYVFNHFNIDHQHMAIGGFSDGASYALCLGLSNGDLFTHILAFSPGFQYTYENKGEPAIFISHGVSDNVLPIDPCSRRIVPTLQRKGYHVVYKEFDGRHEIPPPVSRQAVSWYLGKKTMEQKAIG